MSAEWSDLEDLALRWTGAGRDRSCGRTLGDLSSVTKVLGHPGQSPMPSIAVPTANGKFLFLKNMSFTVPSVTVIKIVAGSGPLKA